MGVLYGTLKGRAGGSGRTVQCGTQHAECSGMAGGSRHAGRGGWGNCECIGDDLGGAGKWNSMVGVDCEAIARLCCGKRLHTPQGDAAIQACQHCWRYIYVYSLYNMHSAESPGGAVRIVE